VGTSEQRYKKVMKRANLLLMMAAAQSKAGKVEEALHNSGEAAEVLKQTLGGQKANRWCSFLGSRVLGFQGFGVSKICFHCEYGFQVGFRFFGFLGFWGQEGSRVLGF
jgi:hypothetical protein